MDSNEALEGDFDFRKMKSLSLVTFPKIKKTNQDSSFHLEIDVYHMPFPKTSFLIFIQSDLK